MALPEVSEAGVEGMRGRGGASIVNAQGRVRVSAAAHPVSGGRGTSEWQPVVAWGRLITLAVFLGVSFSFWLVFQ